MPGTWHGTKRGGTLAATALKPVKQVRRQFIDGVSLSSCQGAFPVWAETAGRL